MQPGEPVIKYYLAPNTDEDDKFKIEEIVNRYITIYGLDQFTTSNLPDYHDILFKPAGKHYDKFTNYSSDIKDLKPYIDTRLAEFDKCISENSEPYYQNEKLREIEFKDMLDEDRCNRIIWNDNYLDELQKPINTEQLDELITKFGNPTYLKTFLNPILWNDNPHSEELVSRVKAYYANGAPSNDYFNDLAYKQFIFGMGSQIFKGQLPYVKTLPHFFKRLMKKPTLFDSCSPYIDWSSILNNLMTKCMSVNKKALFPIMFILPSFPGFGEAISFRDKYPIDKKSLFGPNSKFIGVINIIYKKDFSKDKPKNTTRRNTIRRKVESRFWTFYIFRINDDSRKKRQSDPITGNYEKYIIVNNNGQFVNYGDIFGQVPITYMELNQLTQKYKMHCFFKQITSDRIPVLYMTPEIRPEHDPIIEELELIPVRVDKTPNDPDSEIPVRVDKTPNDPDSEIPAHSFVITPITRNSS